LAHRDQETFTPGHELSSDTVVLDTTTTAQNAPTVTLAAIRDKVVHVQLLLGAVVVPSTYVAEVMKSSGEVVYSKPETATDVSADRVSFDLPSEPLAAGDFQIKLTRMLDGKQLTYFIRVR
jgi:hypothetical protein